MIHARRRVGKGEPDILSREILRIGFRCRRCGTCCRGKDHLVLVMPDEVRAVLAQAGGTWQESVEPYPEFLEGRNGTRYTLGWCLRRNSGACHLLSGDRCTVYGSRPRICRTYPFVLTDSRLEVSPCPGIGAPMTGEEALVIASALKERATAEDAEEVQVARVLSACEMPAGCRCVVDTEGIRVLDG
ncbi:MAG: YkgJ family cysteine cluster protein [Methanomicrobiales archaeon]|nr:YkgJ family cysteine cluster protein [Methanomicrobiales archaeon]